MCPVKEWHFARLQCRARQASIELCKHAGSCRRGTCPQRLLWLMVQGTSKQVVKLAERERMRKGRTVPLENRCAPHACCHQAVHKCTA